MHVELFARRPTMAADTVAAHGSGPRWRPTAAAHGGGPLDLKGAHEDVHLTRRRVFVEPLKSEWKQYSEREIQPISLETMDKACVNRTTSKKGCRAFLGYALAYKGMSSSLSPKVCRQARRICHNRKLFKTCQEPNPPQNRSRGT